MKLVFANHEPFDPGRARAMAMLRTVAAVARRAPVTLLSPDDDDRLREVFRDELRLDWPGGLTVRRLPSFYKRFGLTLGAVFLRALRAAVREIAPDILWLRSDKLAGHFAGAGIPLAYECHMIGALYRQDRGANERKVARLDHLERKIFAGALGVAVINRAMLDEVHSRFGYTGPTAIIQGAVEATLFRPAWNGGDSRTVVYCGTMQFWKGLDTLVQALALAPALRLLLIGGGSEEDVARLRESVNRLGVKDRVEFAGRLPQRDLPARLAQCACAVHPLPPGLNISERLTSPLKVFEYMAVGVPVVASDVPSLREFLTDGENARLYPAGDAGALARALQQMCADVPLARRISTRAIADSARFTFDARAESLLKLFGEIAAR